MKKVISILTATAVLSLATQKASAGDREWATTGKILTGLVIGGSVARALQPPPVYAAPVVVYAQPQPVVYAPAPAHVVVSPAPVYVQPAPAPVIVYSAPAPIYYVRPAPVCYYGPPPLVSFRFGFGGGYHHHRGRW